MKATELKLGDWVDYKGEAAQIHEFLEDVVWLLNGSVPALMEDIEPLPLTPEILEKNGWRKDLDAPLWTLDCLGLYWYAAGEHYELCIIRGYIQAIVHIEVRDVHELQHLLWALGVDDDLKI